MNVAILLSGGMGTRIYSQIPKQYISVCDKRVITYSLETLVKCSLIDQIYIVADSEWRQVIQEDAIKNNISLDKVFGFAEPGTSRQKSIWKGLQAIASDMEDYVDFVSEECIVLIHDAARPLLRTAQIETCFDALKNSDGVMPIIPMKDTLYFSEDGRVISKLLNREKIFAGQAPEIFRFEQYYLANQKLLPSKIDSINGSSEPAIMDGMNIALVMGDETNYKITTDVDLDRFVQYVQTINSIT